MEAYSITVFYAIQFFIKPYTSGYVPFFLYDLENKSNHIKVSKSALRIEAHNNIISSTLYRYLAIVKSKSFSDTRRNILCLLRFIIRIQYQFTSFICLAEKISDEWYLLCAVT